MQINTEREATISNVGGSSKFKIAASAKAFQILSSGLYERKIEALVRELSTNAYDSHVQAGKKEVPFRIQMPTVMNDFVFAVEDFGVGLSEDEVYNVYTTYFESTKTDSNDVIGALGLGSKTPFSYTDSFTVKARKDGKECVFTAFIGTSGEPEVNKMYERPWTGENGVEVSVEVASKDVGEFISCAEKVLSWFEVKPECNRELNYNIDQSIVENVRQYGYYFEDKSGGFGRSVDCKVLMGNVAYDIDVSDLKDGSDIDNFIEQLYRMRADVYFQVAIGEADVAASRETLSLDDKTKDSLRNRLGKIRVEMKTKVLDKIKNFKNILEAKRKLSGYEQSLVKEEKINGYPIGINAYVQNFIAVPKDQQDPEYHKLSRLDQIHSDYDISIYEYSFGANRGERSTLANMSALSDLCNTYEYEAVVVVNDCERKTGLKAAVKDNNDLPSGVIVIKDKNTVVTQDLKDLLDYMTKGCYKIVYASSFWNGTLSKVKSVGGKSLGKTVVKGRCITQNRDSMDVREIDLTDVDVSRWAYIEGKDFGYMDHNYQGACSWIVPSDLRCIAKELDLDGILLYNGNNEKKIKRILGEDRGLTKMILEKASKDDLKAISKRNVGFGCRTDDEVVFKEFEKLIDNMQKVDVKYPTCSRIIFGTSYEYDQEFSEGVSRRKEVLRTRFEIAKRRSSMLKYLNRHVSFWRDPELVKEIREYIKQLEGK